MTLNTDTNNNKEDFWSALYHTRWEHRVLYNNTNNTDTHTRMLDKGIGMAVKNSLEIIIKHVRPECGFKRGGKIRVVECLRQTVPNRWASIRK